MAETVPLFPLTWPSHVADIHIFLLWPHGANASFWKGYFKEMHGMRDGEKPKCKEKNGPHLVDLKHLPKLEDLTCNRVNKVFGYTGLGGY